MTSADAVQLILASGVPITACTGVIVAMNAFHIMRIETQVKAIAERCELRHQEGIKRDFGYLPFLAITVAIVSMLLTGCVQTRFQHGTTSMTRTSLLTRVNLPSLELGTNGTLRASLTSEPKTELVQALLKFLLTSAVP